MRKSSLQVFLLLVLILILAALADLATGSLRIPIQELLAYLSGRSRLTDQQLMVLEQFRLPRLAAALLAGAALPLCGLMMQTLFRNPLAGPYILGISSGASLGAALVVMGAGVGSMVSSLGLALAAWIGAALVMLSLLLISLRIRDVMTILVLGIMLSGAIGAVISIMQYFSGAEALKSFVIWSMGSLGSVNGKGLKLMALVVVPLVFLGAGSIKALNALLLGEEYARSMGIAILPNRIFVFLVSSLLAGTITAFCGPIGFIGIAVPHVSRVLFNTADHRVLYPATILCGMIILTGSDLLSRLPGSEGILPINAVTSLVGIPVVVWLVFSRRQIKQL
ncbi:MAG: iron ABC transporter [Bacteroidetes bacterium]|nr:MAG: iron ABC transporter [Bacteroidota bacterium]